MRKSLIAILTCLVALVLASCSTYLCPTYSKASAPTPKHEKAS